jgi:ATP-binding cassette, subfamily G (WHITE), member 2
MDMENHEMISMLNEHDHAAIRGSTITFNVINYSVVAQPNGSSYFNICCPQKPKQILYDLSGIFQPGINAILGPTGSGKSSLLDILAGRKDRQGLTGSVLMNGQPQTDDYKYRVGYVVQDDMISGMLTVRENLTFSASVRLPRNVTHEEKMVIVRRVIGQLELEKCADTRVGTENSRGVSGGERRRTNIGMELVLSPSVLFLDEPTTGKHFFCSPDYFLIAVGLDSSTAQNVIECLDQLSKKGRASPISSTAFSYLVLHFRHDHLFHSSAPLLDLQTICQSFPHRIRSLCLPWTSK